MAEDLFLGAAAEKPDEKPQEPAAAEKEEEGSVQFTEAGALEYKRLLETYGYDLVSKTFETVPDAPEVLDDAFMIRLEDAVKLELLVCPDCGKKTDAVSPAGDPLRCSKCEAKEEEHDERLEEHAPEPAQGDAEPQEEEEPDPEEEREERARRASEAETVARLEDGPEPEEPDLRAYFIRSGELARTIARCDSEIEELKEDLKRLRKRREERVLELVQLRRGMNEALPLFDNCGLCGKPAKALSAHELEDGTKVRACVTCIDKARALVAEAEKCSVCDGCELVVPDEGEGSDVDLWIVEGKTLCRACIDKSETHVVVGGIVARKEEKAPEEEAQEGAESAPEEPAVPLSSFRFSQAKQERYAREIAEEYGEALVVAGLLATEELDPTQNDPPAKVTKPILDSLEEILAAHRADETEKETEGADE